MPLSHIQVIDLTRARAGPTCVRQLADMGAQVIKSNSPRTRVNGAGTALISKTCTAISAA